MSVPTTKESQIRRCTSDLRFPNGLQPRVSQFGCGIAPSQVRDSQRTLAALARQAQQSLRALAILPIR